MKLLKAVLHCNNFIFLSDNYLQVGGIAMVTRAAPSYANIFMGDLEHRQLKNAPVKPLLYLRYIDDIFCIFDRCETKMEECLHEWATSQN